MGGYRSKIAKIRAAIDHYGTRDCRRFRDALFDRHQAIELELLTAYLDTCKVAGHVAANTQLRQFHERLQVTKNRFSATMDDDQLRGIAEQIAAHCERVFAQWAAKSDLQGAIDAVREEVEAQSVVWPALHWIRKKDSAETIRDKNLQAVARVKSGQWWRMKLRQICGRKVESVLRDIGVVRKFASPYVSGWAYRRWVAAQNRNAGVLANMDAINEEGEAVPLDECVKSSVANPENRRNELMTRIRGWEEIAEAMGLRGLFMTLTAPSKYHSHLAANGQLNDNYNGATPRETQDYLSGVWSRIRSAWARAGIKAFGFRVCEPHHDGTPHYHFLLFFSPDQTDDAWAIFRCHALAVDGDERGAEKYRADCKAMDPGKGTAAGYIAKYISKNIDGFGFAYGEIDDEGGVFADEGAGRVRAWASIHGIRQFQQIGACSVTVWRELRRRAEPLENWEPEEAEALRAAADAGDWAQFVELMGGAFVRRDEQTMRALHVLKDKPGQYGEEVRRILGLIMRGTGRYIQTRFHDWRIVPNWQRREGNTGEGRAPPPLDLCQ